MILLQDESAARTIFRRDLRTGKMPVKMYLGNGRCCCVRNWLFTDATEEQTGLDRVLKRNPRSLTQWLIYMPPCTCTPLPATCTSYRPDTQPSQPSGICETTTHLSLRPCLPWAQPVISPPTTHDGLSTALLDPTYSVRCATLDRRTNDFCTPQQRSKENFVILPRAKTPLRSWSSVRLWSARQLLQPRALPAQPSMWRQSADTLAV